MQGAAGYHIMIFIHIFDKYHIMKFLYAFGSTNVNIFTSSNHKKDLMLCGLSISKMTSTLS